MEQYGGYSIFRLTNITIPEDGPFITHKDTVVEPEEPETEPDIPTEEPETETDNPTEEPETEPEPDVEIPTYSEGLDFTSNGDGTCYVSGIGSCEGSWISIPPTSPNGDTVTGIGNRAFYDDNPYDINLRYIEIPKTVTRIEHDAFFNCMNLESISVAKGNPVYHSAGDCLIETKTKTLILGCVNSIIPGGRKRNDNWRQRFLRSC